MFQKTESLSIGGGAVPARQERGAGRRRRIIAQWVRRIANQSHFVRSGGTQFEIFLKENFEMPYST